SRSASRAMVSGGGGGLRVNSGVSGLPDSDASMKTMNVEISRIGTETAIRRTAKASIRDLPVVGTAARGAGYAPSGAATHDRVTAPDVGAQLDARRPHSSTL